MIRGSDKCWCANALTRQIKVCGVNEIWVSPLARPGALIAPFVASEGLGVGATPGHNPAGSVAVCELW